MKLTQEKIQKAKIQKALDQAIAHYERMIANPLGHERPTADGCPLCKLFNYMCSFGCPVWRKTGQFLCSMTPYERLRKFARANDVKLKKYKDVYVDLLKEELEFLKSLKETTNK